jgi:hypothetical protein
MGGGKRGMSKQPETLRLADELADWSEGPDTAAVLDQAASELRRLYLAEQALDRCRAVCDATSEGWRADAERWQAQRDALLEALAWIDRRCPAVFLLQDLHKVHMEAAFDAGVCARAAIKAVEENT